MSRRVRLSALALLGFSGYIATNQWIAARVAAGAVTPAVLGTPLDAAIPFVPWTEVIYASVYLFMFLPVLHIRDDGLFARAVQGFLAYTAVAIAVFVLYPVRMHRAEFEITDIFTWGVALNYALDPPFNNFPSLHVCNALYAGFIAWRIDRPVGAVALAIGLAISVSTLLVKQHWLADVAFGAALAWVAYRLIVAPAIPAGADAAALANPRGRAMVLVWIYAAVVLVLGTGYALGWQPFAWPVRY